ncbi:unnamed protein product [Tilletia laevis]|uniref:Uncharacterized protein n=1 Tax=Tilletia controversa TaxID=13291 RepID=A0A8X7MLS7_9BASI|nr:hypothetical protein CF328_g8925 [Tilletia controversa]KAE8239766.1 hypothetical protein A4X06_0g8057 [Tilletia controversa]CAD6935705.1 unnamed protein product [Tilletia laevis]
MPASTQQQQHSSSSTSAATQKQQHKQKPLLPKHIGQISAHTIARRASRTWSDDAQASSSRFRASSTVQTSRDLIPATTQYMQVIDLIFK